jgi:hypothetical protein
MRYQEWWWEEFPKRLSESFEVVLLGEAFVRTTKLEVAQRDEFSPMEHSLELEFHQLYEYLELPLLPNDVLLLADLSYPGIFANALFHKKPKRCYAICHATSKNRYDYFSPVRYAKYPVEKAIAKLFDGVIVGSHYHKDKLGWDNVITLPLPYPTAQTKYRGGKHGVCSVSKRTGQKVNKSLEDYVSKQLGIPVLRFESDSWEEYYRQLNSYKVMLITSKEETFGYQVVDGVLAGCIVVAPNKFSYPELLPASHLYNTRNEMVNLVQKALRVPNKPYKLKTDKESKSFFKKLIQLLKK